MHTLVFEYLHSEAAKTVPTLQQLIKIDMTDMSQGIAVSSFDQRIPTLLSENATYSVVKVDDSYFDRVKSFKDWNEPHMGYRDHLKEDLSAFELPHKLMVVNSTLPSSPLQATASYSISWIEALINFIDITYSELTRAKFSSARGWRFNHPTGIKNSL
jgi:hypothetical protein